MNSTKQESLLTRHAKFILKELSAVLKLLSKTDFTDELKEDMRNLSQEMINVTMRGVNDNRKR